ncbi:MAG: type 2 isopentenyl-diphosphate Delta-isomerase [Chloroflexi bacterium]|nr:type 2 isopentenyl-diphosphate Delta-isomerase [Chloroflexota bacterium]MBU1749821.1 type 2 isopentenyl-diphosphate Delta-isomerase [Chloroflexota bacterium]MBU1879219.1 type 2 isopentenyl-diphosphate Delta-isomerase [Chloroflexota bacterium]
MHSQRKLEHLRICLEENVESPGLGAGFDDYRFTHRALPEFDLAAVDTATTFLGHPFRAPILLSAMTGGTSAAQAINCHLAEAAQELGLGLGVGSQRAAIEDPDLINTYQVRQVAPDIFLAANLGAIQLKHGYGVAECQRAVDMIQANALVLHLNPLQESLQGNGNTDFSGLLARIEAVCRALPVPVLAKEVGWGLSEEVARQLVEVGVAGLEVAGAGGTSWSEVEKHRAESETMRRVAEAFANWGIPTAISIQLARRGAPHAQIVGSGGVRTGIHVAKAVALGADIAGLAAPLLRPATVSGQAVCLRLHQLVTELRVAMFCVGARTMTDLRRTPLQPSGGPV